MNTHVGNAFRRVLERPGSRAARLALANAYREDGQELRALLIEDQIHVREAELQGEWTGTLVRKRRGEAKSILQEHGREFAGPVADLVDEYEFHRGLVAHVKLSGERFLTRADALFEHAPIQHLQLTEPFGDLPAIYALPEFAKLSSLLIQESKHFGDAEAIALAKAPNSLRYVSLWDCGVDRAGVEALAASTFFTKTAFISLRRNPCDPTPTAEQYDTGGYGSPIEWAFARPPIAEELEKKFGPRPWLAVPTAELPSLDDLATTD